VQSTITRLALFQFLAVGYSIVGVGTWMKLARLAGPPGNFAGLVRNYGFLLLLLPAIWLIAASIEAHRPKRNTGDVNIILFTGVGLLASLLLIGFFGTMSATAPLRRPIYDVVAQPTPAPTRISRVME
jgi:hypothetical protein